MIRKLFFLLMIISIVAGSACNSASKITGQANQEKPPGSEEDIPYKVAQRYFVNNTVADGDLMSLTITSKAEFDTYFTAARITAQNGKATAIDFSKEYVLAVIGKPTDRNTSLAANGLKRKDNEIIFSYKVTEGEQRLVTIRPALLIVVDNKYQGEIRSVKVN